MSNLSIVYRDMTRYQDIFYYPDDEDMFPTFTHFILGVNAFLDRESCLIAWKQKRGLKVKENLQNIKDLVKLMPEIKNQ